MACEFDRLVTFETLRNVVNVIPLAHHGLQYTGQGDELTCSGCHATLPVIGCNATLPVTRSVTDILEQHRQLSPSCQFSCPDVDKEIEAIYDKVSPLLDKIAASSGATVNNYKHGKDADDCAVLEHSEIFGAEQTSSSDINEICRRVINRGKQTRFRQTSGSVASVSSSVASSGIGSLSSSQSLSASEVSTAAVSQLRLLNIDRSQPNFEQLRSSSARLLTFYDWPTRAARVVDPQELATAGLFYTGHTDRVQCAFCRGYLRNWIQGDKPSDEHRKHFPDCPFLLGQITGVDHVDISQSSAQFTSTAGVTSQNSHVPLVTPVLQSFMARFNPRHPEFGDVKARIDSFQGGRVPEGQDVKVLADAGFYYVGPADNVRCYYCDGGLKNWQPADDPWTEHGRWFPRCPFILDNRDQTFVHKAQIPRNLRLTSNLPANSVSRPVDNTLPPTRLPVNNVQYRIEPREIKARMDSPLVRTVIEMGYQRDVIRQAIERRLTTTGDDFPNVASLLEAIFELEELLSSASQPVTATFTNAASLRTATLAVSQSVPLPNTTQTPGFTGSVAAEANDTETATEQRSEKTKAKSKKKKKKTNSNPNTTGVTGGTTSAGENAENGPAADVDITSQDVEKLEEENRQLKEARTCRVCMDVEINTVFLPCGHLVCCDSCSRSLQQCPICRAQIRGTVKTFLS